MAKYQDRYRPQANAEVKRRRHEHWRERHERRYVIAQRNIARVKAWCQSVDLGLRVTNDGHHWIFSHPSDAPPVHFGQWWPRTAKMVVNNRWDHGIHAHDVLQVMKELQAILNGEHKRFRAPAKRVEA